MSFLSLAKGDPAARTLLQRAIRARYGMRPLPIESVRVELVGQRKGWLGLPVKVVVSTCFITGSHWRWDETWQLFGLKINQFSSSFDGGTVYFRKGANVEHINDTLTIQGARRRLWAEASALLTPLTVSGVVLKSVDERTFSANLENEPDDIAKIRMNSDDTIDVVQSDSFRTDTRQSLAVTMRPSGLQTLEGFTLPKQMIYEWTDQASQSFAVVKAEANPKIPLTEFTMG